MAVYKIVGKYRDKKNRASWQQSGKAGVQAAKRVYTTESDYEKYSPKLIKRWLNFSNYDVEIYKQDSDAWVLIDSLKKIAHNRRERG